MPTGHDGSATRFVEDAGFLLSNLGPKDTGVHGVVIWFAAGEFSTESQHGPRILVAPGDKLTLDGLADSAAVTITSTPEVLGSLPDDLAAQVIGFVQQNWVALLSHWNGDIDTGDVIERLQRV